MTKHATINLCGRKTRDSSSDRMTTICGAHNRFIPYIEAEWLSNAAANEIEAFRIIYMRVAKQ